MDDFNATTFYCQRFTFFNVGISTELVHFAASIPLHALPPNSSWPLSKEKPLISRCYCDTKNSEEDPMEISACVRGSERNLVAKGRVILSSVPENVIISSADSSCHIEGVFLGAHSADSSARHVLSLGILSDAPGKHNFELLRKLVLPDGSVLRARLPGRPTADCLFSDPTRDGISLLKIWNMNTFTGVLGVYNCQGAAWSSSEKKNTFHPTNSAALTSSFRSNDIHLISEAATEQSWNGNCSIYSHGKGALCLLLKGEALPISLNVLEHEVFTVSPIKVLAPGLLFAPLGLLDMFNAGGAIEGLKYEENVGRVCMEMKGCGRMGAYASAEPKRCLLGAEPANFIYDAYAGLLTLLLEDMPEGDKNVHTVVVEF